jgi:hemolysin D
MSQQTAPQAFPIRRRGRLPVQDLSALPTPRGDRAEGDQSFLPPALAIIETKPGRRQTILAYAVCGLIAVAVLGALLANITILAVAPGKVQAVGQTKIIQAVEAGQVSAIPVREGDHVRQGDVLLRLDPTSAIASRTVIADNLLRERAEIIRRRTEIGAAGVVPVDTAAKPAWDAAIPAALRAREEDAVSADLAHLAASIADLQAQRKVKEAARDSLAASVAAQAGLLAVNAQRVDMHQKLEGLGWDSQRKVLEARESLSQQQVELVTLRGDMADAEAALPVIDQRIAKTQADFIADNTQKLAEADRQVGDLTQQLAKADWTVAHLTLRAPVGGIVHGLTVTSLDQSIAHGDTVMQVVPEDAPLEVVAYVLNTDIGFVRGGQPVDIKVDTFPYTRYGTLAGRVTQVAADAISGADALRQQKNPAAAASTGVASDTNAAQQTTDLVFPVTIAIPDPFILVDGKKTRLSPGMSVVAEIATGRHSIIGYIMYPLVRGVPQKGG